MTQRKPTIQTACALLLAVGVMPSLTFAQHLDASAAPSAQPSTPTAADAQRAVAELAHPNQRVRDAAAEELRRIVPMIPNLEGTAAAWQARTARFSHGSVGDFERELHATMNGGGASGGGTTMDYRVDDYWTVTVYSNSRTGAITRIDPPRRSIRHVWVDPPANFTGRWTYYYANGERAGVFVYRAGIITHSAYYDEHGRLDPDRH